MARKKLNTRVNEGRLNQLIETRMRERLSKPLIKSPKIPEDESTKISKIIKEPEVLVKTGKVLENNKVIDANDKISDSQLINLIKPLDTLNDGNVQSIVSAIKNPKEKDVQPDLVLDVNEYNEEDKRRIYIEELERRQIEDERFRKIQEAFSDETLRRESFKKELIKMKLEFDLYLKEKYPDIVGEKNIKDVDIEKKKEESIKMENELRAEKERLKNQMIRRVEEEKLRKKKEVKLLTNTKTAVNVSTFLEEEIIIEQQQKKDRTPELSGLNKVQQTIKEVNEMEIRLGRPIVPHRDIIDTDESDFDSEASTNSNDILIKPSQKSPFENYDEKRDILEALRQTLQNGNSEEDLSVMYDKQDRKRNR